MPRAHKTAHLLPHDCTLTIRLPADLAQAVSNVAHDERTSVNRLIIGWLLARDVEQYLHPDALALLRREYPAYGAGQEDQTNGSEG
jgi:hypothetical protein